MSSGPLRVRGPDADECARRRLALAKPYVPPGLTPPPVAVAPAASAAVSTTPATRLLLLAMVRNESRIITRCLDAAGPLVQAVCLVDTGSTDDTVAVATAWAASRTPPLPLHVHTHAWKDFGHNRTLSFEAAVATATKLNWPLAGSYALLQDADMQLKAPQGAEAVLRAAARFTAPGYRLVQMHSGLEYENTRLLSLAVPWRCVGVTHEYWSGGGTTGLPAGLLHIQDHGDGGCKDDKYVRDCAMLERGLADEPDNVRYMFYLANTYRDLGRNDDGIAMYKRRIAAGGWEEEVWCSMLAIAQLYERKRDYVRMEAWGQRAHAYRPVRAECLHLLTRVFRERGEHFKAWQYMLAGERVPRPADVLFVNTNVYVHGFAYERALLAFYVTPHQHANALHRCITLLSSQGGSYLNVYNFMQYYVQRLPRAGADVPLATLLPSPLLPSDPHGDFVPSSTAIAHLPGGDLLLNVRCVNYRITPTGAYVMHRGGAAAPDEPVRTRNVAVRMKTTAAAADAVPAPGCCWLAQGPAAEVTPAFAPVVPSAYIRGLEDVRLHVDADGSVQWIAATMEYGAAADGRIQQVAGVYDLAGCQLRQAQTLVTGVQCEKNWVPIGNKRYIYRWHPFEVVAPAEQQGGGGTAAAAAAPAPATVSSTKVTVVHRADTPAFFQHLRGSSNIVHHKDAAYCLVHIVHPTTPRKYSHMVMRLDAHTFVPLAYTVPFYFCTNAIEYTLGLTVDAATGLARAIVSQNDCNPVVVTFDMCALRFYGMDSRWERE